MNANISWEVAESQDTPTEWIVEAIDYEREGVVYAASFSGPDAEQRAREYAAWKSSGSKRCRAE